MDVRRQRWITGSSLFVIGFVAAYVIALIWAPHLPGFCGAVTVGRTCESAAVQTVMGYVLVAIGFVTMVFAPIAWAFLEIALHGGKWETQRGPETTVTNLPIAFGLMYMIVGVVLAATA